MPNSDDTRVLYNAECPVCRFEIDHYARLTTDKALPIAFDDLSPANLGRFGLTKDQAARRLHVMKDGQIVSGIPAFLLLWAEMPRYRWLAHVVGLPGLRTVAGALYDHVLAPALYLWHRRRERRRKTQL